MKKLIAILSGIILMSPAIVSAQGCMEPSSDQGASVIGFIQPQFEYFSNGVNVNGSPIMIDGKEVSTKNSFAFERARLGVTGNIPYDVSYYVMAEFSDFKGGPYLLDAFVTYTRLGPWAKFSLGQFKAPVSLELQNACHKLHTVYRSLVVQQLVAPWRDLGLMVSGDVKLKNYGGLTDHKFFSYQLAIMNGTGINTWDNNNAKDIAARGVFSVWKGIDIGGSFRMGNQKPFDANFNDGTGEKVTFGGELSVDYFNFLLQAEYLYGYGKNLAGVAAAGCGGGDIPAIKGELERNGYYAMLLYNTPWNLQPVVKYEYFNPNAKADYALLPSEASEPVSTLTFGFNYFINDWSRVQVNYMIHDDQNVGTDELGNNFNNSLIVDANNNHFKQQFVIQLQAVLQ
ncbi:MAG: porin [Bacteroidales bacterium]|nr:porin [Bacteroidales bacterium]